VKGLTKAFQQGDPVLYRLDLSIDSGEIFGIIGPNGSGKTTLLRLIAGYLKPEGGAIWIKGEPQKSYARRRLARIVAFVPQESHVAFSFSVMEVVLQGRYPYLGRLGFESDEDLDVVRWAMEITDTFEFRDRVVGDLSGGERQRVVIARALAQEPEILLLDEPTSFLDIKHQVKIHELLRRLNREQGVTVISVLHDLTMASTYFDRLCLLHEAGVQRIGTPAEVIQYPLIREVYDTEVYIDINSVTGRPYIIPLGRVDEGRDPSSS
jgi:iron complex transport system ATP-binding protein